MEYSGTYTTKVVILLAFKTTHDNSPVLQNGGRQINSIGFSQSCSITVVLKYKRPNKKKRATPSALLS